MSIKKLSTSSLTILISLLVISAGGAYYFLSSESRIPPAQIPPETMEYFDERDRECPILKLKAEGLLQLEKPYQIVNVSCDYDNEDKLGYDSAQVEISTKDFEAGKASFRDWLKSYHLEEGPKLRVTFIHLPED